MPNKRPVSRKILIGLGAILLTVAFIAGIQAIRRTTADEDDRFLWQDLDTLVSIQQLAHSPKAADRKRYADLQRDYDEWFAKVLARNPGLEPQWKQVPDERNGFLQLLVLAERHRGDKNIGDESLPISEELAEVIWNEDAWDPEFVATALEDHQDLLDEITRIGLLPDQSAANISVDRYSFFAARFSKQCCEFLMADARLAAETGHPKRALERARAAMGMANHYSGIEAPSLLIETVAVLVRLNTETAALRHVLPVLDPEHTDFTAWREALDHDAETPHYFSRILRGEAYVGIRGFAIPLLAGEHPEYFAGDLPDPDLFLDAMAGSYLHSANKIEDATIEQLWDKTALSQHLSAPPDLSSAGREAYGVLQVGAPAWGTGWARAASIHVRTQAAFAILAGTAPPVEPITGLPYVLDPEARTLAHPDDPRLDKIASEPITLP